MSSSSHKEKIMTNSINVSNIVDEFLQNVNMDQLYKIYEVIRQAYTEAESNVSVLNMDSCLERQTIGLVRANLISDRLQYIHSIDTGIKVSLEPNSYGTKAAKININERFLITVKGHDDPYTLPEESLSRKKDARLNPNATLPLFNLLKDFTLNGIDQDINRDNYINCIITHKLPKHVSIIFPCKQYKTLLFEPIDLLRISQEYEIQDSNAKANPINIEKKLLKFNTFANLVQRV